VKQDPISSHLSRENPKQKLRLHVKSLFALVAKVGQAKEEKPLGDDGAALTKTGQ
jgi:hypothetical protein